MYKLTLICLVAIFPFTVNGQDDYRNKLIHYRDSIDAVFGNEETSILTEKDIEEFKSLEYFEPNEKFRVKARFRKLENTDTVRMKTSGTRTPLFRPYGTLSFTIDKIKFNLTIYQSADPKRPELGEYLLLAFTDQTTGIECYGGGRYLEFDVKEMKKKMILDFNYCFNPYCAYNHKYSCVVPPSENYLDIRIEAGVRKFHD